MAIIKCPECGHQTSDKATVCPSCGVEIAGKITKCTYCGEVYFKNDGLCPNCYRAYHNGVVEDEVKDDEPTTDIANEETPQEDSPNSEIIPEEEIPATNSTSDEEETTVIEDTPKDANESMNNVEEPESVEDTGGHPDDDDEAGGYIDTDGENLEKPIHEADDEDSGHDGKHGYINVIVSLAITALIIAVCFYFYNESKLSRETQAYETAMRSNDVNELKSFLRNFNDASETHRKAVNDEIMRITKQKEDLSLSLVTREKAKLEQYLKDYPDSPQKLQILSIIDSLDWEDALKTNTKAAYDKYIAAHADGHFIKEAKDKVTVKIAAATAEDEAMAKSLFREFFLSVNGNDANRLTATLNPQISQFMGTENATSGDVTGWMKKQHGDDVSNVIWKLNHDYKITKREQGGSQEYVMEFTAKQTIVKKDGRASSENYKITSNVTGDKKISSMSMTKYTPQASPAPSPTASESKTNSANSQGAKPSAQSNVAKTEKKPAPKPETKPAPKAASETKQASKPETKSTQKSEAKPASKPESKPAQKPAQNNTQKPAQNNTQKPAQNNAQKPAQNNTQKPAQKTSN